MKDWTIGRRITIGFAILLILTITLGTLSVIQMRTVSNESTLLSTQKMPTVSAANNIERDILNTRFEMRGYGDTENTNQLNQGREQLAQLRKHIDEAQALASRENIPMLRELANKADKDFVAYERLVNQTVTDTEGIHEDRRQLDAAASRLMTACYKYLDAMTNKMKYEIGTNAPTGRLVDRLDKIDTVNIVINAGYACRLGAWRSQAERDPQRLINAESNFKTIKTGLDVLRPITTQSNDLATVDEIQSAADAYKLAMDDLLRHWQSRDQTSAERSAAGIAISNGARETCQKDITDAVASAEKSTSTLKSSSRTVLCGLAVGAAIGMALSFLITQKTNKILSGIASHLADGSYQVSSAAGQVSGSSQTLAEGASEQAAAIEETSSSLEEMSSMTKRNAENAQKATDLAKQARTAADKGVSDMRAMNSAMEAIKVSSDDIAKIIKTIDEIAFQTNILALNAAVEAARAGEAGMGFAVVADEVRSLAQRSAQAAKETAAKIESAIAKTAQGVGISATVAEALNDIVAKAKQVDELAAEVASASREQTQGITQINSAIGQMDKVTQGNAANAEESAAAAEELNAQAETLKDSVSELLKLVGGKTVATAQKGTEPAIAATPKPVHKFKRAISNNRREDDHRQVTLAIAAKENARSEIPLEAR